MLVEYRDYLCTLRDNLIRCGVGIEVSNLEDYSDIFYFADRLQDILWFYSILAVANSRYRLKGFVLQLSKTYSSEIKRIIRQEYLEDEQLLREISPEGFLKRHFSEVSEERNEVNYESENIDIWGDEDPDEEEMEEKIDEVILGVPKSNEVISSNIYVTLDMIDEDGWYTYSKTDGQKDSDREEESEDTDEGKDSDEDFPDDLWDDSSDEGILEDDDADFPDESGWGDDDSETDDDADFPDESGWGDDDSETDDDADFPDESGWEDDDDEGISDDEVDFPDESVDSEDEEILSDDEADFPDESGWEDDDEVIDDEADFPDESGWEDDDEVIDDEADFPEDEDSDFPEDDANFPEDEVLDEEDDDADFPDESGWEDDDADFPEDAPLEGDFHKDFQSERSSIRYGGEHKRKLSKKELEEERYGEAIENIAAGVTKLTKSIAGQLKKSFKNTKQ